MTVKAKRFRIGVEGATTDGREIQREWLEQMAASYNPAVYTALINLEHIKSYLPDSTFNRYGKVTALSAISEVNAELYEFRRRQQMLGYASLAEVPAEQLDGKSERIQHYFNAVYCWARAMLNERYQDYDATASGVKRGEELAEASGDLWRDARWAICRVQDAPHCTVELI
ncbi:head completion/stabilization protein [Escherichia coli]|nr:head completion/stabilization protein [Escherichia coli]EFM2428428.1 head completion/stabilization protein [Escherichia coli]EFN9516525.1 head completion/stabilization protein [Escherichia coli]EFO2317626.1 head completion/stabilization protein [Escherichia coli]EFT2898684.1 head completion/stabilization protein [Escherichia coli]